MNIQGIKTQPDPYEPYLLSQAIKSGPFVFVSGQAGYDDDGNIVQGGFSAQGEQAFHNLNRALTAAGSSLEKVAHWQACRCLQPRGDFSPIKQPRCITLLNCIHEPQKSHCNLHTLAIR